jgi:hypothetical protein
VLTRRLRINATVDATTAKRMKINEQEFVINLQFG